MVQLADFNIRANFQRVRERICQVAHACGRNPDEVRLVVVTKGHPLDRIQQVLEAGATLLGENYVEEAVGKIQALAGQPVEWHMIGHVQSRKAKAVCEYFSCLHSLDSRKLALRLDRFAGELGRRLPVLLECNVSGEASKFGLPAWDPTKWTDLQQDVGAIVALSGLEVKGLMTMAPFLDDPEDARPYFQLLRRLCDALAERFPQVQWDELSMGMSADFEVAIQEGATLVRIGTAILGPRPRME